MSHVPSNPLQRYRPIIDDWSAFDASCRRPLPTVLWANTLRITPGALVDELQRDGVPGQLRIRPATLEGLRSAPGLTTWGTDRWPEKLAGAMRIWPHHNDT